MPFDQPRPKEIFELFDLATVLALSNGICARGLYDAAAGADFHEGAQSVQRKPTFSKQRRKHDWIVKILAKIQLQSLRGPVQGLAEHLT
ncbi:MAG: hypothetical protein L0Y58_07970 [Verrucomicrobia subdivision 3 bacterium]|nr:hypothetical protein [Limisphaerales bacterium]